MKTVGFFVCHFTERGTEVAIYDYADHNETLLGNKSIIYCFTPQKQAQVGFPSMRTSYDKFKSRFSVIEISDFSEIKDIDVFYTLTHGGGTDVYNFCSDVWKNMRTVKHCVFDVSGKEGDVYCVISNQLNRKYGSNLPVIPHMVCIGKTTEDLRSNLNIPKEAIVYGRYGGYDTFSVQIARQAVFDVASQDATKYFLFMNTPKFCNLPNVIFLGSSTDMEVKRRFINTCDAFLHGRSDGETFGLSIAEFALCLKPIVSNAQCTDDAHFQILGNQIIKYHNKDELVNILKTFVPASFDMTNNGYLQYTPENVMKIFNDVVFPRPRKIVDGFTFYNELAMLKYRLEVLYPFVDQFIISESTLTYSGKRKELYYENNKQLFSKYHDKIVHVIVDDVPETEDPWVREKHQRRCISRGFGDMADSDIILISDLDEIPNPSLLQHVRESGLDKLYCLKQDFYYYNLNTRVGTNWIKAKILPYSFFMNEGKQDLELCRSSFYNIEINSGGWHLSYFGDQKFIANKIRNFSHQEYNSEKYTSEDLIAERLKNGINLFDDRKLDHIPFEENQNLPPHYELLIKYIEEAN